jgi:hypothetical protein
MGRNYEVSLKSIVSHPRLQRGCSANAFLTHTPCHTLFDKERYEIEISDAIATLEHPRCKRGR